MKKKMVAVWALAAVLCFGTATISALAAEGWAQSGSTWVYYDSNGNKIYNTWKKRGGQPVALSQRRGCYGHQCMG